MPRYTFETPPPMRLHLDTAIRLVAQRFPELSVERDCVPQPEVISRDHWLCRAPSEAHVRRWAAATGVVIEGLRRFDENHPREEI